MNNNIIKVLRYVSIYGLKRSLVKVAGRINIEFVKLPNFKSERTISFVGCGQFPFSTIAYFLYLSRRGNFLGCYDIDAIKSNKLAKFWGFSKVYKNYDELFLDDSCRLIYIASNHSTHYYYAIKALKQNIDIYIEKPIVVSFEQLVELKQHQLKSSSKIYVGYNRPFSKAIRMLSDEIYNIKAPMTINCFISGHKIPFTNWYRNPVEGTRVCGNLGHWLDLIIHLFNKRGYIPSNYSISITYADVQEADDNISVSISTDYNDVVSILLSSRSEPFEGINETINVQCGKVISKIDDFRSITIWENSKRIKKKFWPKDVGHKKAILQPFTKESYRDLHEIELSTLLMLKIKDMVLNASTQEEFNLQNSYKELMNKVNQKE